jgi:hypothetical protein
MLILTLNFDKNGVISKLNLINLRGRVAYILRCIKFTRNLDMDEENLIYDLHNQ